MESNTKLVDEDLEEIEFLVSKALAAYSKRSAEPFIKRLEFLQRTMKLTPYRKNVFLELVAYVKAASGQVRDKEHWIEAVESSLYKLKTFS